MNERGRRGFPQEGVQLKDLQIGEEFSPFKGIVLPNTVNPEMEDPLWSRVDELQYYSREAPRAMVPNFSFTIDGMQGGVHLFRGNPLVRSTELPLGEVQTIESFSTAEHSNDVTQHPTRIVKSMPLNFGVLLEATTLQDIDRIANLIFEAKIGENTYRLSFVRDTVAARKYIDLSQTLKDNRYYSWMVSSVMEKGNGFANVVLPYKKSALNTVKATFLRTENPEAQ